MRDAGSNPGSGRCPGEGNRNSRQYSCLENPKDRGARRATGHRIAESDTTQVTHVYTDSCRVVISFGRTPKGISYAQPLFFWISSPFRSPQSDGQSRLCVQEAFSNIYSIHSSVYVSMPTSQLTASVPSWYPCLCLCFCFANNFICTIFLHISNVIYFSLSDLLHSV